MSNDDWRNYVPPIDRGEGERALPAGVGRRRGPRDGSEADAGASRRGDGYSAPGKRGVRIKRTIVFVHADRDEHVDAETAARVGIVLKGSPEWIRFDSKREAKRFVALRNEQKAGQIRNLQRQVKFALQVQRPDKLQQTIATWTADFVYERYNNSLMLAETQHWQRVVEDCKGMRTEIYQRSKKHFESQYGIEITES